MKRALKRMKIQQFFKKNRTAQNFYDKGMGAVDLGYDAAMGAASTALAPQLMANKMVGQGLYTGGGLYTGMGEYMPATNDLISKSSMEIVPQFGMTDDDTIIIRRREYVSEIFGPDYVGNSVSTVQPFVVQSFPINPGLERTFPWLSQIAQNYDEYELLQCIFTFKSTTTESTNSANGQVGTVIMATNYNAAAPTFKDKATMQRYMGAVSSRLTESTLHGVECDPSKLSGSIGEYVRTNPVVTGQDVKTYDHGLFQIAIANASAVYANVSIGELWVSYTVKLRKSKFFTSLGFGITKDIFLSNGTETVNLPFGDNSSTPVYSNATAGGAAVNIGYIPKFLLKGQQNNLGCQISQPGAGEIYILIPASYSGYIKVMYAVEGTGFTFNTITAGNLNGTGSATYLQGNITRVPDLYASGGDVTAGIDNPLSFLYSVTSSGAVTTALLVWHLKVDIATNGIDNLIFIQTITGGTTITQSYLDISEYNAISSGKNQGLNNSDAPTWVNAISNQPVVIT